MNQLTEILDEEGTVSLSSMYNGQLGYICHFSTENFEKLFRILKIKKSKEVREICYDVDICSEFFTISGYFSLERLGKLVRIFEEAKIKPEELSAAMNDVILNKQNYERSLKEERIVPYFTKSGRKVNLPKRYKKF